MGVCALVCRFVRFRVLIGSSWKRRVLTKFDRPYKKIYQLSAIKED